MMGLKGSRHNFICTPYFSTSVSVVTSFCLSISLMQFVFKPSDLSLLRRENFSLRFLCRSVTLLESPLISSSDVRLRSGAGVSFHFSFHGGLHDHVGSKTKKNKERTNNEVKTCESKYSRSTFSIFVSKKKSNSS